MKLTEEQKTAKALKIELAKDEKKVIANTKGASIIEADLDNKSLMGELVKITVKDPNSLISKANMFRFDTLIDKYNSMSIEAKKKQEKNIRKKARKLRNMYINNVIHYFKDKDNKELKQTIKSFMSFYKEYYLLNDLSIKSICRNSSDNDTLIKVTLAFQVIKNNK